jgi:predicted nucleotidyltransferase
MTVKDSVTPFFAFFLEYQRWSKNIGMCGSITRGYVINGSDVDILVEFHPVYERFYNFMQNAFYLEEVLGIRVDLLTRPPLSPVLVLRSSVRSSGVKGVQVILR